MVVAFRKHTWLPLNDCLYALQETRPHLTVLDATGRAALRQSVPAGESGVDLDLSALPSGVYAVILNGGRGPQVARVVKE